MPLLSLYHSLGVLCGLTVWQGTSSIRKREQYGKSKISPHRRVVHREDGNLVFRRSHNGKVSVYQAPYMEKIKWSPAQKDQRQRMGEASRYASAAVADPDIRPIYVQMALEQGKNPKRPFDMAVSDYFHHGNDLLWKKHMGDQEKPQNWPMHHYSWYSHK